MMRTAVDSVEALESQWRHLAAERSSLSAGWRDKAARTFDHAYWADLSASIISSLTDLRESIEDLQRVVDDTGTETD